MRACLLLLLLVAIALTGCTSLKKKAALNNPPPIAASGGPMDPNKPQAKPGEAPAAEPQGGDQTPAPPAGG